MSGFDNEVVYAEGIDLTNDQPNISNQLASDGFLYFGNSAGRPMSGLPTSVNDTIVYHGAEGSGRFENRRWLTSFVVDPSTSEGERGTYQTIAAAMSAASSGTIIFLRPGTYTEDFTMKDGIIMSAFGSSALDNVLIKGKLTFTGAITASFQNIRFETNSDVIIDIGGTGLNQTRFTNCQFVLSDGDCMTINNSNGNPQFKGCTFNQTGDTLDFFNITLTGGTNFEYCNFLYGAAAQGTSTVAAGQVQLRYCRIQSTQFTTSSTGYYKFIFCESDQSGNIIFLTTAGTGTSKIFRSRLQSGTASAISIGTGTTVELFGCNIESSNTNPVTGAGTVIYDIVGMSSTGKIINTTSKTARSTISGEISFDDGVNYLDYYEEGSWTPAITGSSGAPDTIGYSSQQGRYTRVGDIVTVIGRISVNAFTLGAGAGTLYITGLPFAALNLTGFSAPGCVQTGNTNFNTAGASLTCHATNSSILFITESVDSAAAANLNLSDITPSTLIRVNITYKI